MTIPAISSRSVSPWPCCSPEVLLRIASTRATRAFGEKGFVTYSSTPSSKPCSSSCSSLFAVSMMIGTWEVLRISRVAWYPSMRGIITSMMMQATSPSFWKASTASLPSAASATVYPAFVRKSRISFLILASSSTTRIFPFAITSPTSLLFLYLTTFSGFVWANLAPNLA